MSAKVLDLPAPSDKPAVVKATIRGTTYTISELTMERYNELLEKATTRERNDITGEQDETVDNTALLRLMTVNCVSPRPEPMKLGVRQYRMITRLVNELHFGEEPVKIEKDDEPSEENPQGNDA